MTIRKGLPSQYELECWAAEVKRKGDMIETMRVRTEGLGKSTDDLIDELEQWLKKQGVKSVTELAVKTIAMRHLLEWEFQPVPYAFPLMRVRT